MKKIKLELPQNCIDESTIIIKEIVHSDEYKLLVEEANERIKSYKDKQFKAIEQAENYIHNYNDLPVVKSNQ